MAFLIDTQAIVWVADRPERLSAAAHAALTSGSAELLVSAVTAFEYADLDRRGRFGKPLPLQLVLAEFEMEVVDFPARAWPLIATLPDLHRDPVDRMLVAHAIQAGLTLVTADATLRRYPVATLW